MDNAINCYFKGYSTECNIKNSLNAIIYDNYRPRGKWAVIHNNSLYHSILRGFPLYVYDGNLTNLKLSNYDTIVNTVNLSVSSKHITLEEATSQIQTILTENISGFLKYNNQPHINVLVSAGLDTLTSWTILDSLTSNYTLDIYIPKKNEPSRNSWLNVFEEYQSDLIDFVRKTHWGYEITKIKKETNWYITGFYAELMQLRTMRCVQGLAKFLNKSPNDLINIGDYVHLFLQRPTSKNFGDIPNFNNEQEFKVWCYQALTGDFQMWHLGNNYHFSPFYDERIAQVSSCLSLDDMLLNMREGYVQRQILINIKPEMLTLLSDYKNHGDVFKNFTDNWELVKSTLSPNIKIDLR